jgi:hypothetical protein
MRPTAALKLMGGIMRSAIVIAAASLGLSFALAGCSSMGGAFKSTPKIVPLRVESTPPGADATSSLGATCKTPCSLDVPDTADSFSVSFALPKYQPLTVPVQVSHPERSLFSSEPAIVLDPNPVVGELQPEAPPKRRRVHHRARRPAAAAPAASHSGTSPAPAAPAASAPPPPPPSH